MDGCGDGAYFSGPCKSRPTWGYTHVSFWMDGSRYDRADGPVSGPGMLGSMRRWVASVQLPCGNLRRRKSRARYYRHEKMLYKKGGEILELFW